MLIAERSKRQAKKKLNTSGGGGRKLSTSSDVESIQTDASPTSTSSSNVKRREAMIHLQTPTTATQHHHDPDELHEAHDSVSALAEKNKACGKKPFSMVKRERTLTEFLMGDVDDEDN